MNEHHQTVFQQHQANIEKYGWSVVGILEKNPYAYSVGLPELLGVPDFVVAGLSLDVAHSMLLAVVDQLKQQQSPQVFAKTATRMSHILQGYDIALKPCQPSPLFAVANALYGKRMVMQVLWPDVNGIFPGEATCDREVVACQKLAL